MATWQASPTCSMAFQAVLSMAALPHLPCIAGATLQSSLGVRLPSAACPMAYSPPLCGWCCDWTMPSAKLRLQVFDEAFRKDFPCVTRWFQTCVHQPPFKAVLHEVQLCKERPQGKGKPFADACWGGPGCRDSCATSALRALRAAVYASCWLRLGKPNLLACSCANRGHTARVSLVLAGA